jgi:hypothetical protein
VRAIGIEAGGVVDEDGQGAEGLGGLGDQRGALRAFDEVGLEDNGPAAGAGDLVANLGSACGIGAIVDDYGMASTRQSACDGGADAAAGAGDERDGKGGRWSGLIRHAWGLDLLGGPYSALAVFFNVEAA